MSAQTSPDHVPGIVRPTIQNEVETASGTSIIGCAVIIKTGRFTNHLARISSLMNNRYNLQVLTDEGKPNRKEDGSTRSTALVRGGFDPLAVPMPRMMLGSIHDNDLPVVLAELSRKREELKLTLFETASNTSSAASFTRPASTTPAPHLVGSPTSRSRLKSKATADDEEQKCTIEEGEESRNNLYWVEQGSKKGSGARFGYVCLWYGGTSVRSTDTIRVLPISSKIRIGTASFGNNNGIQGSSAFSGSVASSVALTSSFGEESSVMETSETSTSSVAAPQSLKVAHPFSEAGTGTAEESGASESETEAGDVDILLNVSPSSLRRARRSDLIPLDEDVVNAKYAHIVEQDHFRHFLLALLAFPEWDYPQRDSYVWPAFVLRLMHDPIAVEHYLHAVQNHPLNNGARPFYDVILFLLCAEHTGVLEEWDDGLFAHGERCADSVQYLLESISDFRSSNEEVYRFSCRVAEYYQVEELPEYSETRAAGASALGAPAAFTPQKATDQDLEAYLSQVQALREAHLKTNQLIEAPLNVDLFEREWELFKSSKAKTGSVLTSASSKYALREGLQEFIATSRRQNKKLTALYTVKHPSCAPVALSTPSSSSASKMNHVLSAGHDLAPEVERLIPSNGSVEPFVQTERVPSVSASNAETSHVISLTTPNKGPELSEQLKATQNGHISKGTPPMVPVRMPASFPTAALTPVISAFDGSVTAPPPQETVVVYSGSLEQKMPLQFCRINSLPDDIALEVLQSCDHDVHRALQMISKLLSGEIVNTKSTDSAVKNNLIEPKEEPTDCAAVKDQVQESVEIVASNITLNRRVVSTLELDGFHSIVNRTHNDARKIHHSFNRFLAKKALLSKSMSSNISSLDKAVGPYFFPGSETASSSSSANKKPQVPALSPFEVNEFPARSMKEVLALYFLFYPGLDDEHLPLMTTFNAPLFRMWNNSSSVAASVMAYGQNGSSSGGALGGKKPHPGEAGYVPRGRPRLPPRSPANLNLPNRWPQNLPLIQHNMYWLSTSNAPCLCTGLFIKAKSNDVQLHMIIVNSEARRIIVQPRNVVPLNDDIMKRSNDERSTAFASALMQFAEWELEHHVPATSLLRKWYVYPEFITQMLIQTSRWLGWRKQADRHVRMAASSRRDGYLMALIEDYKAVPEQQHSARYYSATTYPWDDSPVAGEGPSSSEFGYDGESSDGDDSEGDKDGLSGIESFSEREDESEDEEFGSSSRKNNKRKAGLKRIASDSGMDGSAGGSEDFDLFADQINGLSSSKKRARLSEANLKNSRSRGSMTTLSELEADDEKLKPPPLRSFYNLFWVPRSQLPCMYYDTPENRYKEQFKLIPICCVTYHYPFPVNANNKGSIEPLKLDHLKQITDERTAEFTHALIEFARKDNENKRRARFAAEQGADENAVFGEFEGVEEGDDTNSLVDASLLQPHELFAWPEFILQLVNQPSQWHSWRKKAERSGAGHKRHQYLKALQTTQEEYEAKEKAERQLILEEQQQLEVAKTAASVSLDEDEEEAVISYPKKEEAALAIRSHYNLFWLLRSNLPAIYYDTAENRRKDKFMVIPINCSQYQYPTHVTKSAVMIEALTMNNLAHCTDDRTHEFTLALIEFAKWEILERKRHAAEEKKQLPLAKDELYFVSDDSEDAQDHKDPAETDNPDLYDWPDFILQMLNLPEKWTAWRKKAERSNSREPKRTVYFRALVDDYVRLRAAAESAPLAEPEGAMVVIS